MSRQKVLECFGAETERKVRGFGLLQFPEDIVGAHYRIQDVSPGFTFEIQGFLEIKNNHGVARKAQKEIAQGANRDAVGDLTGLILRYCMVSLNLRTGFF